MIIIIIWDWLSSCFNSFSPWLIWFCSINFCRLTIVTEELRYPFNHQSDSETIRKRCITIGSWSILIHISWQPREREMELFGSARCPMTKPAGAMHLPTLAKADRRLFYKKEPSGRFSWIFSGRRGVVEFWLVIWSNLRIWIGGFVTIVRQCALNVQNETSSSGLALCDMGCAKRF